MIFLSAGHSTTDPGATAFGRREADIACDMRNMVSFYLSRAGIEHALDGKGTANIPLRDAVKIAARHSPSIEFHCNASDSPSATGVETLQGAKDTALGSRICKAISGKLAIRNRGAKPENAGQHHRLAFVQAGGIIVELFFLTNREDLRAWDERKWLAAQAVADVLMGVA